MERELQSEDWQVPGVELNEASYSDCAELAPLLRQEDREECRKMSGADGLYALVSGLKVSEVCVSARYEGTIVSMFGYHTQRIGDGIQRVIWMLGSELMTTKPIIVVKLGRMFTLEALHGADVVGNWVDSANHTHMDWLWHIGYRPTMENLIGPNKYKFYWFQITKEDRDNV